MGRLNDIATPLWQLIKLVSPSHCPQFEDIINEFIEKRRQGKSSTLEGEVIKALLDLQGAVEDSKIEVDLITDRINQGRKDFHKESSRYIGKVLRRLGFQFSRTHASKRRYYYDAELLSNLATEYGLRDTPPDLTSLMSLTSPQIWKNQLQGDIKDDRDIKTEPVSIPSPTEQPDEPDLTLELLASQGWCLWQCSKLDNEIIAVVRDESVKDVPNGYPVYTKAELEEVARANTSPKTIRLIHEAKKRHQATVQSVIASPDLSGRGNPGGGTCSHEALASPSP